MSHDDTPTVTLTIPTRTTEVPAIKVVRRSEPATIARLPFEIPRGEERDEDSDEDSDEDLNIESNRERYEESRERDIPLTLVSASHTLRHRLSGVDKLRLAGYQAEEFLTFDLSEPQNEGQEEMVPGESLLELTFITTPSDRDFLGEGAVKVATIPNTDIHSRTRTLREIEHGTYADDDLEDLSKECNRNSTSSISVAVHFLRDPNEDRFRVIFGPRTNERQHVATITGTYHPHRRLCTLLPERIVSNGTRDWSIDFLRPLRECGRASGSDAAEQTPEIDVVFTWNEVVGDPSVLDLGDQFGQVLTTHLGGLTVGGSGSHVE